MAAVTSAATSIKQFFTHRTERPVVSSPTVSEADPSSPEAADAGYQSASVIVGETPLRIYAKNERTLCEIQGILSQPDLMSGEKINAQQGFVQGNLDMLGFHENTASKISGGFCCAGVNCGEYVKGNEVMRQAAKGNGDETERNKAGSFQSCQPPDKARIAGAKAFVQVNSWLQNLTKCATKCVNASTMGKGGKQKAARKQVMEELLDICNEPEHRITTLERCVGGNNIVSGGRVYDSLLSGPAIALQGMLQDSESNITADRLKELAGDHGHEFVEKLVKTAYRTFPGSVDNMRPKLKAAYEAYCQQAKEKPTNLDGLLFNDELRGLVSLMSEITDEITKNLGLSSENKEKMQSFRKELEQNFQTWLSADNKKEEDDGSITIDLGHIRIMVNAEQLKEVTLQSLTAL
ncbi:MAG: hypothetical protein LBF49_01030 [Puniceicoccales bacterium]|nr:hypothetical protein [Puniceicoccales bacterium]